MRTAKEIHLYVGVPLTADYVDKMRPEYRCYLESDVERIQKEAVEFVLSALGEAFPSPRTSRDCVVEKNLRDILSARVAEVPTGSDCLPLLAEREN